MIPQIPLTRMSAFIRPTTPRPIVDARSFSAPSMCPSVVSIIRRMRPEGRSLLIKASDMSLYVMKEAAPPGQQSPFSREACGAVLAAYLALPMAWSPLSLSPEVASLHAGVLDTRDTLVESALRGCIYFGSRVVCGDYTPIEYLTKTRVLNSEVRKQMVRMAAFDLWIGNRPPRQYVAFRKAEGADLSLYFIGGTVMPAGAPPIRVKEGSRNNPYWMAYDFDVNIEVVDLMLKDIFTVSSDLLFSLFNGIPESWQDSAALKQTIHQLCMRREELMLSLGSLRTPFAEQRFSTR